MSKKWQRARTTRVYIHPPKSERMFTMWREGKFCFGENDNPITDYMAQISSAIWFVDGDGDQLDFRSSEYVMHPDGIPVHGLVNSIDSLEITFETFATCERKSVCYIKLTVKNISERMINEKIGFVLRTGQECKLLFDSPDNYGIYAPKLEYWNDITPTWKKEGNIYRDGDRIVKIAGELDFAFDEHTGFAFAEMSLSPGESREMIFAYSIGEFTMGDYAAECSKVTDYWKKELSRINKIPENIAKNPEYVKIIKNLTVHILQMFCYSKGNDYLLSRQGGLQRQIWTGETIYVLEMLHRIGDFDDYIEQTIDTYFNVFWTESGEVVPLGIWWAMQTGNVIYSFADYAAVRGKEYYDKYRDKAAKSFEWMVKTRASTVAGDGIVEGLFPPLSSCDDELVFQNWLITDPYNIVSLERYLKTAELFNDPISKEVKKELDDYRAKLFKYWEIRKEEQKDSDELEPCYAPVGSDEKFLKNFLFARHIWEFMRACDISEEDCERVLKYYKKRGLINGGLYNKMPNNLGRIGSQKHAIDAVGNSVVWYVATAEYGYFKYFHRHGMNERCEEMISDLIKYAMTDEYYMIERFNQDEPYFIPWSPNASANGRLITMILDYYG